MTSRDCYLARVVEIAATQALFADSNHPYTLALLAEVPRLDVRKKDYVAITGEIPSPLNPPSGCHFHPRCSHAMPCCKDEQPQLREISPLRFSACHLNDLKCRIDLNHLEQLTRPHKAIHHVPNAI